VDAAEKEVVVVGNIPYSEIVKVSGNLIAILGSSFTEQF